MPRKPKKQQVIAPYYVWLLGQRNGIFYADGRGNKPDLGRHSLGVRDETEARRKILRLDLKMAVKLGRADRALLNDTPNRWLPLDEGMRLYLEHAARPAVQGGVSKASVDRYTSILKKFVAFAVSKQLRYWQQISSKVLRSYGKHLHDEDYAGPTQFLEQNVVKQAVSWMIEDGLLPSSSKIHLPLKKTHGTSTYCYTKEQVHAMIEFCKGKPELNWLGDVVTTLATTGFRISELINLQWSDVDLTHGKLRLTDTTLSSRKSERDAARTTKSHRGRTIDINSALQPVLERMFLTRCDNLVFHEPGGGKLKGSTVREVLQKDVHAALAAKFPSSGDDPGIEAGRLHSFRHFFCSWAADTGIPEQTIMKWLGHRESEMIRYYYHLHQDESRRQMDKLVLFETKAGDQPAA